MYQPHKLQNSIQMQPAADPAHDNIQSKPIPDTPLTLVAVCYIHRGWNGHNS